MRHELDRVASEIDAGLLSFASPEARHEWVAARAGWWPASPENLNDDDLNVLVQKVRRFSEILQTLRSAASRPDS